MSTNLGFSVPFKDKIKKFDFSSSSIAAYQQEIKFPQNYSILKDIPKSGKFLTSIIAFSFVTIVDSSEKRKWNRV